MTLVRRARAGEAQRLSALAVRAKAHWGYAPAMLRAWAADLAIGEKDLATGMVWVAECDGVLAGYCSVDIADKAGELMHCWVEPAMMRRGVGRALLRRACQALQSMGIATLAIDSDPHAEPFYLALGARRVGAVPAPIATDPRRTRPQLVLDVVRSSGERPAAAG